MSKAIFDKIGITQARELVNLIVGKKIGSGQFRDTYEFLFDDAKVIKVERGHTARFCNVTEWEVWNAVTEAPAYKQWAKWFAPCRWISNGGNFLIQDKVAAITELPCRVPDFFGDLKLSNWGRLPNGRIVCYDYGNNNLLYDSLNRAKLRRLSKKVRTTS